MDNAFSTIEILRKDCAVKQKRGLHFIVASVLIWAAVLAIQLSPLSVMQKNMLTFCCSAPLMPLAYGLSKILNIDFNNKSNPLTNLGILFSVNQMVYILIAMWVFSSVPDKMLMVYAMIFGAHLMPYGWLYKSKAYYVMSVFVSAAALFIGVNFSAAAVAMFMLGAEIVFCGLLARENSV